MKVYANDKGSIVIEPETAFETTFLESFKGRCLNVFVKTGIDLSDTKSLIVEKNDKEKR